MDRERLDYLIGNFCDHALSPAEAAELNAQLAQSDDARRQFVVLVDQHRQLSEWHAAGSAAGERTSREAAALASPDAFMRALMVRYLEGSLDALGTEALQVFLQEDPKACDEFAKLALEMGKPLAAGEKPVLRPPVGSGVGRAVGSSARRRAVARNGESAPGSVFTPRVWIAAAAVFLVSILSGALWWSLWLPPPAERTGMLRPDRRPDFSAPSLPPPPLPPPKPLPPEPGRELFTPDPVPGQKPDAEEVREAERLRDEAAELHRLILSQQRGLKAERPRVFDPGEDEEPLAVDPAKPETQETVTEAVPVGRVIFVEPEAKDMVVVRKERNAETRTVLAAGAVLLSGDRVETRRLDDRACAAVRLENGATIDLGGETTVQVRGVASIRLDAGRIYACYKPEIRTADEYGPPPLALETAAGRYLTSGAQMEIFASKNSIPAQTGAKIDAGRVHLFNEKGRVLGVRGQEVQAVSHQPPVASPSLTSAIWRGRDLPFESLPCGASTPLVVMDEDPFSCLLQDYAFALANGRTRNVLGLGVGSVTGNPRDRFNELGRYARTLRSRGVVNLPEVLLGCDAPLVPPASGRVEETRPVASPAVKRLVELCRQTRPDRPLVVICAGALTEVASAWLTDPVCAENLVVVCGYGGGYKCAELDPWATSIVLPRFRCVVLNKTYTLGLDEKSFDRIRDRRWQTIARREGSKDLVLLAAVALPGLASSTEQSVCVPEGKGQFRFIPKEDGRIWLVKDVRMDVLKQDVQQTFFGM